MTRPRYMKAPETFEGFITEVQYILGRRLDEFFRFTLRSDTALGHDAVQVIFRFPNSYAGSNNHVIYMANVDNLCKIYREAFGDAAAHDLRCELVGSTDPTGTYHEPPTDLKEAPLHMLQELVKLKFVVDCESKALRDRPDRVYQFYRWTRVRL